MACAIVAIGSAGECPDADGGILYSYVCKKADITAVTATANVITTFTMASTGLWFKWEYANDNTALFNQVGTRAGNRRSYEQTGFLKFPGFTEAQVLAADNAADCCALVAIHILTNGKRVVQGIELDAAATGGFTGTKILNTRVTPSQLSDTSENEARLEMTINGTSKRMAPFTDLTDAEIEAL